MEMRIVLIALACATLAGCSTITRGTTDQVLITTTPPGASVRTSLNHTCQTPCTLTVGRKDEFVVTATMQGYKDATTPVKTRLAGAGAAGFAGNVLVGGVIGMGVDAATGATLEHFPSPVAMVLEPNAAVRPAPSAKSPKRDRRNAGPKPVATRAETAPST